MKQCLLADPVDEILKNPLMYFPLQSILSIQEEETR